MGLGFSSLCRMAHMLNFEYKIAPAGWSEMGILFSACGLTWHIDVAKGRKGIFWENNGPKSFTFTEQVSTSSRIIGGLLHVFLHPHSNLLTKSSAAWLPIHPLSQGWAKKQTNGPNLLFIYGEFRKFSSKSGDIKVDSYSMMCNP